MTKWIERYRRQAEERYRRLDALLAELNDEAPDRGRDHPRKEPHHDHHARGPRPPSRPTRTCRSSASPASSTATPEQLFRAHTDPDLFARWVGPHDIDHEDRPLGRPHRRLLALRGRRATARSTPSAAASTTSARTGSCRRSPARACPTASRWRRCASRTSATAAPGCVAESLVRQLRGPRRVAGQRHGGRRQRGLRQARQDAGRWRRLMPRRAAPRGRPGVFTDRVRGTRDWDAPAPVDRVDGPRRRRPPGRAGSPASWRRAPASRLPAGPAVDDDPVGAWQVHADAVQARARRPGDRDAVVLAPRTSARCRCPRRSTSSTPPTSSCTPGTSPAPPARTRPSTPTSAPSCWPAWSRSRR